MRNRTPATGEVRSGSMRACTHILGSGPRGVGGLPTAAVHARPRPNGGPRLARRHRGSPAPDFRFPWRAMRVRMKTVIRPPRRLQAPQAIGCGFPAAGSSVGRASCPGGAGGASCPPNQRGAGILPAGSARSVCPPAGFSRSPVRGNRKRDAPARRRSRGRFRAVYKQVIDTPNEWCITCFVKATRGAAAGLTTG